jgi:predicted house-cleaning NTP pyrophosphatase (Maf/HAM1 superfamily)
MVELEFVQKSPQFDESELMKRDDLSPDKLVQMIAEKKVKKKLKLIKKLKFIFGRKRVGSSSNRLFNLLRHSNRLWKQNLRQAGGQNSTA